MGDSALAPVLTVTTIASELMWQLVDACADPESAGVRIAAGAPSDGGGPLELALVEGPEPGDEILQAGDANVFVDPRVASALRDTVLDAQLVGDGRVRFALREADGRRRTSRNGNTPQSRA
jgi:Fe-S cluster assembly iron-binding protein IscA